MKTNLSSRDIIKFSFLVGLCAIFIDAVIAHGLFWENDPYWTYWVTKTLLIITVFGLGSSVIGIGLKQGLMLTVIHTLILEVYYDVFAPIGLPQEPQWLSLNDLWGVGVVTHYLAILAGYLIALWLWRRAHNEQAFRFTNPKMLTLTALLSALLLIVLDGVITQGIIVHHFFGWTFFVQHLLISFVFLFFWFTYSGLDTISTLVGALLLSLIWLAYSLYLGPIGLPLHPPTYLSSSELWLKSFPGALVAVLLGLWLVTRFVLSLFEGRTKS